MKWNSQAGNPGNRKGKEMKQFAFAGTISWGTLRPQDLIPRFAGVLAEMGELTPDEKTLVQEAQGLTDYKAEQAAYVLDELFDALREHAPEGYYFGANEGDGADFGFWSEEEEEG